MGKKRKHEKNILLSKLMDRPAGNPFGVDDEPTFEGSLLADLKKLGEADASNFSISGQALEEGYTSTPFPSWKLDQTEPITKVPQQGTTDPAQVKDSGKSDETLYEYDVAEYLASHYQAGLFEGIPYIRMDGVDVALNKMMIGSLIDSSLKRSSKRKLQSNAFNGIQTWLQIILNRQGRVLHRDPRLILFANGCYDFLTGERIPDYKLRDKFFPVRVKASFIPDGELETPVWDQFIEDCSGGVREVKLLMQEFVGYLLSPSEPDQIMLLSPCAGSGKSVLANFTRELLGMDKTCAIALSNFGKSFEVSQIYGKVANFCLDISGQVLSDAVVAMLKRLTGAGDPETINIKYKDPFPYINYAKLVFACNESGLRSRTPDTGLARRLICIPFLIPCPKNQVDKRLREKLWAERDAIVTKVILNALRDLYRRDYSFTYTVEGERLKKKYMRTVEPSVQMFVDSVCCISPEEREWTSELHKEYVQYCEENGLEPVSRRKFAPMIYSLPGVHQHKFQQNYVQLQGAEGICLKR